MIAGLAAIAATAVAVAGLDGNAPNPAVGRMMPMVDDGVRPRTEDGDAASGIAEVPLEESRMARGVAEDAPAVAAAMPAAGRAQQDAFQIAAIVGGGIAEAVAIEMVEAATQHRRIYESLRRLRDSGELPAAKQAELATMDFFFAAWPDLGAMARDGRIQIDVHPVPEHARGTRASGHVLYSLNVPDRRLGVSFHTPRWLVRTRFDEAAVGDGAAAELFRRIYAATPR
jgi:hypothetical protein